MQTAVEKEHLPRFTRHSESRIVTGKIIFLGIKNSGILVIFDDNTYIKKMLVSDCNSPTLEDDDLNIEDLAEAGLVLNITMDRHKKEIQALRANYNLIAFKRYLAYQVRTFGVEQVKSLLQEVKDE